MPDFLLLLNDMPAHRNLAGEEARQIAESYAGWMRDLKVKGALAAGQTDPRRQQAGRWGGRGDYRDKRPLPPHIRHGSVVQVRQVPDTAGDHLEEKAE